MKPKPLPLPLFLLGDDADTGFCAWLVLFSGVADDDGNDDGDEEEEEEENEEEEVVEDKEEEEEGEDAINESSTIVTRILSPSVTVSAILIAPDTSSILPAIGTFVSNVTETIGWYCIVSRRPYNREVGSGRRRRRRGGTRYPWCLEGV